MHIPFTKDKTDHQEQHAVTLEDNSMDMADEESTPVPPEEPASPSTSRKLSMLVKHPHRDSKPHQAVQIPTGVVDVLYENQRGSFLCGIPLFSAAGLWITDPHAWVGMDLEYSPFTIFNATLPDPTWEWVWKRWFVDMSGDVDENGWSYNVSFTRHHWHGHHIWYHSFVRRRRWLRKRRKMSGQDRAVRKAKNPAEDYFTISSSTFRGAHSYKQHDGTRDLYLNEDDEEDEQYAKLENLGDFYQKLRSARLDREKLDAVDNFLTNGKELGALAKEMKHILRFMIFQESRRQLLALLARRCQEIEKQHMPLTADDGQDSRHQCVQNAIYMAEVLIPSLDYFSDRVKCSREEEEAELDRLQTVQLQSQEDKRGLGTPRSSTKEAAGRFQVVSLQESADAAISRGDKKNNENREKKSVSFIDLKNAGTISSQVSSTYSGEEKGKGRER